MPATATVQVKTLFSPFDDAQGEFLRFIGSAHKSIFMLIYGYHLPALSDALIAKHQAGVKVNIILDHSQEVGRAERAEVQRLVDAGIPLLVGTSPLHGAILHTKATVIDEERVESGSWNYSVGANSQSNTQTYVQDCEYARAYLDHWHRIWGFVKFHDAIYQPPGAVAAEDVPTDDVLTAEPVAADAVLQASEVA